MYKDNEHSPESDAEVSAAYAALARESVPVGLDSKVLRQAKLAVQPVWSLQYLYSVRRPVAFAATLVLSLGIVLQFNDLLLNVTPDVNGVVMEPGRTSAATSDIAAAIDGSGERLQEQGKQGENVMSQGLLNKPMPPAVGGADAMGPKTDRFCESTQVATADLWWACILRLDSQGRLAASATERELLVNTYPDFLPAK